MSSLLAKLAKAKSRLFGSAPESIAVPFEVPCDCGHRVTGIRRTSYQIAVCSACQSSIYVLPVNVYPTTKRIRSEVVDGPVLERVGRIPGGGLLLEVTAKIDGQIVSRATATTAVNAPQTARFALRDAR